jgi:D-amino-acid dehydrogenase
MNNVVVIGGGIVGASAAYHLAKAGHPTVLVDRHDQGHATAAGAGIVSPGTSLKAGPEQLAYSAIAVRDYASLVAELDAIGAPTTAYDVVGELLCARTDEEYERLPAMLDTYARRAASGMPNMGIVELVDGDQARAMFPALGDFVPAAIHISGAARVDGAFFRDALVFGAQHHGAILKDGDATLIVDGTRITGVDVAGERIAADAVIVAAGAWTNALIAPIGLSVEVEPQRGQILHLHMPGQDTSRWPIIQKLSDQYILTFGPDRVVVGATREFGSGFDYRLTVDGTKSVLDDALSVAPGLGVGTIGEWRIGFRPYAKDTLPYLGIAPGHDNLVIATGLGPSGLTLGPYSGRVAAELATGVNPEADISAFAVDRHPA